jgi:hypothetical protein
MTEELGIDFRQEQESSLFFKTSRLSLGPTTPPKIVGTRSALSGNKAVEA